MLNKKEIGQRIKYFLQNKYGTIVNGAKHLDTTSDSLRNSYFNGKALPGADLLMKLNDLGCDIHWLLTGETTEQLVSKLRMERDLYKRKYEELKEEINKLNIKLKT